MPQMLAPLRVIRSENGATITTPSLLEGGIFVCLEAATAIKIKNQNFIENLNYTEQTYIKLIVVNKPLVSPIKTF